MKTPELIFSEHFVASRMPRSIEFKTGFLAALRHLSNPPDVIKSPYRPGSAVNDAFWSGVTEGTLKFDRERKVKS